MRLVIFFSYRNLSSLTNPERRLRAGQILVSPVRPGLMLWFVQVRKSSLKPIAVFKMADYRHTLVTSLVTRPGSVPTLAIVERI